MMRIQRTLSFCLVLCLAQIAVACSVKAPLSDHDEPKRVQAVWNRFHELAAGSCVPLDFFARGSINYTSRERSSRLLFSFWGHTHFPVRMDLQAGVGAMLAHWREDESGWVGYHPGSQEAFASLDSRVGAASLGLAMPLRLNAFAKIITGCWSTVVPAEYMSAKGVQNGIEYLVVHQGNTATLTLSLDGRPKSLQLNDPQGWMVAVEEWLVDKPLSPRRLRLAQDDNVAVVRLQRLEVVSPPWPKEDLVLDLPPGTTLRHLDGI